MVTALPAATGDNSADAVLGQLDFSHHGINNTRAASINSPAQIAVDLGSVTEHLYVVDGANNRILGWNDAAGFTNGQNADLEIGQPDFQTTRCNGGTAAGDDQIVRRGLIPQLVLTGDRRSAALRRRRAAALASA